MTMVAIENAFRGITSKHAKCNRRQLGFEDYADPDVFIAKETEAGFLVALDWEERFRYYSAIMSKGLKSYKNAPCLMCCKDHSKPLFRFHQNCENTVCFDCFTIHSFRNRAKHRLKHPKCPYCTLPYNEKHDIG